MWGGGGGGDGVRARKSCDAIALHSYPLTPRSYRLARISISLGLNCSCPLKYPMKSFG